MKKVLILGTIMFFMSLTLFSYVNPDYRNPVINVVNATADAVVKIDVEKTVTTSVDPFMEEFFKRFFGEQQNPMEPKENKVHWVPDSFLTVMDIY